MIDSSRYYVLRVEDGASGRHAFLGLGFGSRGESSDFNAALSEHRAYIQRKRQAEETRREWEEAAAGGGDDAEGGDGSGGQAAAGGMAAPPVGSALHASLARPGGPLKLRLALPPAAGLDGERRAGFVSSRLAAESTAGSQAAAAPRGDSCSDGQRRLPLLRPPPGKLAAAPSRGALPPAQAASTPGDDAGGDWGDFLG